MRGSKILIGVLLTIAAVSALWSFGSPLPPVNHRSWERDFDILLADLARGYANLDWLKYSGRVDPPKLAAKTRVQLRAAWTNHQARRAIEEFVDAFGDPHLRIEGRRKRNWLPRSLRPGRLTFDLSNLEPLPGALFQANLLPLGSGKQAGVIRIESFGHEQHMTAADGGDHRSVMKRLVGVLNARVGLLAQKRVNVLLVDIRGNGGGTDWAEAAARLLTDRRLSYGGSSRVITPEWTYETRAQRHLIQSELQTNPPPFQRSILEQGLATIDNIVRAASARCARQDVWTPAGAPCSSVVRMPSGGLAGDIPPEALKGLASAEYLFSNGDLILREGAWKGPLVILMDGGTASAAEHFAALLKDSGAALLAGSRTAGAGCGYVNGGLVSALPHSGIRVLMPNCSRYRMSGENEIAGIAPDLVVRNEDDLLLALRAIVK